MTLAAAQKAYRQQALRWHPDKNDATKVWQYTYVARHVEISVACRFTCDICCNQEQECRVKMSDINAAHLECMQRLSHSEQNDNDTSHNPSADADAAGDNAEDVAEQYFKQFRENRQQRREEEKRMQKV